jgi:hypothetical protein
MIAQNILAEDFETPDMHFNNTELVPQSSTSIEFKQ